MSRNNDYADSPGWCDAEDARRASWAEHQAWIAKPQAERDAIIAERDARDAEVKAILEAKRAIYKAALAAFRDLQSAEHANRIWTKPPSIMEFGMPYEWTSSEQLELFTTSCRARAAEIRGA